MSLSFIPSLDIVTIDIGAIFIESAWSDLHVGIWVII